MRKFCSSWFYGLFVLYFVLTTSGLIPILRVECLATLAENPRSIGRCECAGDETETEEDCCTKTCCNRSWEISGNQTDEAFLTIPVQVSGSEHNATMFAPAIVATSSLPTVCIVANGLFTHSPPYTLNRSILFQTLLI